MFVKPFGLYYLFFFTKYKKFDINSHFLLVVSFYTNNHLNNNGL